MKWIESCITTTTDGTEYIEQLLPECGVSQWQVIDLDEMRRFLHDNPKQWDYLEERLFDDFPEHVTVKFYVTDSEEGIAAIDAVKAGLNNLKLRLPSAETGPLALSYKKVDDDDWLDNWKKYFKPLEIGKNLVIKPAWEEYSNPDKTIVSIDPDRAFGTGQHETTQMCIEALERCINHGDTLLDLGCGSGILSVTAIMLGAEKCVAADINPNAEDITYQNAALNGISKEKLHVYIGDILTCGLTQQQIGKCTYDCIVTNIVADTVISVAKQVAAMQILKTEGVLIVSGILEERRGDVLTALNKYGFRVSETASAGQWVCITAQLD